MCVILCTYKLLVLSVRKCMFGSISILLVKGEVLLHLRCCFNLSSIFSYPVLDLLFYNPFWYPSIPVYIHLSLGFWLSLDRVKSPARSS